MSYTDGRNGVERNIHLPRGTMGRACELYAREDWEGLEGFEVWSEYCHVLAALCRYEFTSLHRVSRVYHVAYLSQTSPESQH